MHKLPNGRFSFRGLRRQSGVPWEVKHTLSAEELEHFANAVVFSESGIDDFVFNFRGDYAHVGYAFACLVQLEES
jgi:hypothetical protein